MLVQVGRKAYIHFWSKRDDQQNPGTDYWFCSKPEIAAYWPTRQSAENDCRSCFNNKIYIRCLTGARAYVNEFEVEEYNGKFLVWFYVPCSYEVKDPPTKNAESSMSPAPDAGTPGS
jgi:hypothetical protein